MTSRGSSELAQIRERVFNDPFVRRLLGALLQAMAKPDQGSALLLDQLVMALTVRVAQVYGGVDVVRSVPRGGLAPWQERRAKELMNANLGGEMPLSRLAASCGLSVRHFARAFRQSTGAPPHRWLLKRRVERATELMNDRARPLPDIAISCGFADQSHFTRVFTALVGVTPNAWRRTVGEAEDLINGARSGA
jgi:transcriptional regulator GlxA family with amidase domain